MPVAKYPSAMLCVVVVVVVVVSSSSKSMKVCIESIRVRRAISL